MLVLLTFTMMIAAPIMCFGGIILALNQDVPLSSLLLVAVPVLGIIVTLIISRMRPLFRLMQTRIDLINRVLREQITGVRVVRAFVREGAEEQRFDGASADLMDVSVGIGRLMALMFPSVMLVLNLSSVAVLWFGGHRVASGGMQIGALTAFLSYLLQILMSVMMATFMFVMVPRAEVSAERIKEVLDTESSVQAPPSQPGRRWRCAATWSCAAREFRYPGAEEPVLSGISLIARPGEITAVIGGTGSGKSTLIGLVPRLFDVTAGAVLIDGTDVRELDPAVLAAAVGPGAAEAVPVLRHRRDQPAVRQARTPPTTSSGTRWRSPRPASSSSRCPAAWTRPDRRRAAPTSPAASGSGSRSPAPWCATAHLPVRRLVLRARLRHRRRAARRPGPRDRPRRRGHRGPAGQHHPARRPDRGARRGPGHRHRHPYRADEHRRDLPGDRAVPAERGGGRMSAGERPGRPRRRPRRGPPGVPSGWASARLGRGASGERATPQRGPGPAPGTMGRGPAAFMGGRSTEKSLDFRGSSRRLLASMRPERLLAGGSLALAAISVSLSVLGPKILGHATDVIFAGVIGKAASAGRYQGRRHRPAAGPGSR